jgi:hypothetical protein
VPYIDFEQAFNWIIGVKKHSFDEKLEKLFDSQKDKPDLEAILKPIQFYASSLMEKALGLAVQIEMLPEKFSQPHYSENKKLKDLLKSAGEVNKIVDSDPMLWSIVFEGRTKSELITYKRNIRDIDSSNKTWAAIQRNKEYFWALSEGCHWLLNELDILKDKISSEPEVAVS